MNAMKGSRLSMATPELISGKELNGISTHDVPASVW
jgi:hypothetical protein